MARYLSLEEPVNTTRSEAQWPYDERSDQVHSEQIRDRERVQQDIEAAWMNVMADMTPYARRSCESDIKLLKWALGVK